MTTGVKQSWVALSSASGSGLVSVDGVAVSVFMVGKILLNYCFRWPFVVAGGKGICLKMSSSVSPGQVVK